MHAGQSSYYSRRDEDIEYLEKITARVILRCFELGKSIDGVGERRTKAWSKYVDNIFVDLIFNATYQKQTTPKSDAEKVYSFDYEPPVSMVAEDPAPYGAKKED